MPRDRVASIGTSDWRFNHVHVYASDPQATVAWLTDGLGGEVVHEARHADYPTMYHVRVGGQLVFVRGRRPAEQFLPAGPRSFGLDHFGLVVDNLDVALELLRARGVEPVTDFDNGFSVPPGVAFVRGPDNLWVEITDHS